MHVVLITSCTDETQVYDATRGACN